MTTKRRFNLVLSDRAALTLDELAKKHGKSRAPIIHDSLALVEWFEGARAEGSRILVERDGTTREIIPRA